uniref:Uncharacterized protein n=1 Tax=Peronospora matthiolae TaxID=2874970 RepID=A0AAV1VHA4_9STRA
MATTDAEQLRLSGFKRILVHLDDDTRRKYCCRAVEEDLKHVEGQVRSCLASMAEVKQVQDATRKLQASQQTAVSSELLTELETLQVQLEMSINKTCSVQSSSFIVANDASKESFAIKDEVRKALGDEPLMCEKIRTLVDKVRLSQDLKTTVDAIRQLQQLMPVLADADAKTIKSWKRHVAKAVHHAVVLVTEKKKDHNMVQRLEKTLKKVVDKCPEMKKWQTNVLKQLEARMKSKGESAVKSKKKRAIALPDGGDSSIVSSASSCVQPPVVPKNKEKKKSQSAEKARAQLQQCSREVRTLRDKFKLGTYDVNLSRMVTIVDSLWSGIEHSEVVLLTTALFTLVETVEKVADHTKRRDRLVCLESVLAVVLDSSKLQLTTRRKIMVEEYANNCRQSLDQLNREGKTLAASSTSEHAVVPGASLVRKNR